MAVLVLADTDLGRLTPATARVVAGAAELGPVDLLVDAAAAEEARSLAGVHRVLAAALPATADALAQLLAVLAEPYTHIVAAANASGRDVIPRLAALLDIQPVTDITAILGPTRFERPIYAGNATETVSDGQAKHVLSLRASAFAATVGENSAVVSNISPEVASATEVIAEVRTQSERPELSTAQIVVSGGIPLGDRFALVEDLAGKLGAAVGATRALVDAGHAPNDLQVGQTGKIVAPDLYVGLGISGALQHLAGIQGAKAIFAINTDADAPLMKIADVALVADLFEAVPAVIAELDRLGIKR
ncbi:MAG: FAD-binding protein [Devosia sp.]|uniref:FAD-binding protein n=1 Tax=Devosia sp. TaxID=1871048 RepID=UPI001A48BAE9|nr:FAD-binding protein [Devosia sp.]MBL8596391.1 FAD-binding protein [Devosia sp.]